jgi:transcriptional regulator with XRE-family HTH domain
MPESFGGRLRQQRERQDVALETIAEQTKIKMSLLEGLERDDVSHWPTGIFRRAFIRAYALAIGLEPDVIVREFLERHPDPADVVAVDPALRPAIEPLHQGAAPPTRFRYLVSSALGSLAGRRTAPAPPQERSRAQMASIVERASIAQEGRVEIDAPIAAVVQEPLVDADAAMIATAQEPLVQVDAAIIGTAEEPLIIQAETEAAAPAGSHALTPPPAISTPPAVSAPLEPDFEAAALVCTELGRAVHTDDVAPLLGRAAAVLDAVGLIVWAWDPQAAALRAAVAHGYSDRVLAQLPTVRRDAANATAAAFRTAQPCVVEGTEHASGALVAPLMTPDGCVGVLAIEWPLGREQSAFSRSIVTIFAALLARWIGAIAPATLADRRLA